MVMFFPNYVCKLSCLLSNKLFIHFSNLFSKDLHNQYFSGNDLTLHHVISIYLNFDFNLRFNPFACEIVNLTAGYSGIVLSA